MRIGKMAMIKAIISGAIFLSGCEKIDLFSLKDLPSFQEMTTMWDSKNSTLLFDPGKAPTEANAAPFLVDIDRNGTMDLLVGYASGRIELILNGSSTDFTIDYSYYLTGEGIGWTRSMSDEPTIFCSNAAPALYDLNNATPEKPDADWAFIVGCGDGTIRLNLIPYGDLTTITAADLMTLPGLTADGGYAVPVMSQNGDTAIPDLVFGAGDGRVYKYGNIGNLEDPKFGLIDILGIGVGDFGSRAAIALTYIDFNLAIDYVVGNAAGDLNACEGPAGKCYFILWAGTMAKPTVGDFNHDFLPDLVYGNANGNITLLPAQF